MRKLLTPALCLLAMLGRSHAANALPEPARPVLRIETGQHTATVNSVAADAAGRFVATASDDKTARLWDAQTGELLRVFRPPIGPGNEGKLYAVALSPDATWLIVGGYTDPDGQKQSLYVFERATGRLHRRIAGLPDVVLHLAVSADGARVAAGLGSGNGVRVFRLPGGEPLFSDADYGAACYGVDFAQDGRLVTSSDDGLIRLYSAAHRRIAKVPAAGGKEPSRVRFSPDGGRIAVGYDDSPRVDVLDAGSLQPLSWRPDVTGIDYGKLSSVAWSRAGQRLCAVGRYLQGGQAVLRCWSQGGPGTREDLPLVKDTIMDLWALPNGQMAYAAGDASWGVVKGKSQAAAVQAGSIADLRGLGDGFRLDASGQRVRFAFRYGSGEPVEFSLTDRALVRRPKEEAALQPPQRSGLQIEGWENTTAVTVEGKPLKLEPYERSRSLAIAGDGSGFVLGTEWWLRRYGRDGKEAWSQPVPDVAWAVNVSSDGRLIVAGLGDGTVRWYRSRDGQELLALFAPADDSGRWVLWTPAGYYDAGPKSEDLIGFHIDRGRDQAADFVSARELAAHYRKREIVLRALQGALDVEPPPANWQGELPPTVSLVVPHGELSEDSREIRAPQISLEVWLRSLSAAPITRLVVSTSSLGQQSAIEQQFLTGGLQQTRMQLTLPVPPEDSTLEIKARTESSPFGAPARLRLRWKGEGPGSAAPRPRLLVLAAGVNQVSGADKLEFAGADAQAVVAALRGFKSFGYSDVVVFGEGALLDSKASKDALQDGFDWLKNTARSNDVTIVYLAGHGWVDSGHYYFLPHGADRDRPGRTLLSEDELAGRLQVLAGRRILFLDSCHSGKVVNRTLGDASARIDALAALLERTPTGAVGLAATTNVGEAQERRELGHGTFTLALLEALSGKALWRFSEAKNQDTLKTLATAREVRMSQIYAYLSARVAELSQGQQQADRGHLSRNAPPDLPLLVR